SRRHGSLCGEPENVLLQHSDFLLNSCAGSFDAVGYRRTNGDGIREDKEGNSLQLQLITVAGAGVGEIEVAPFVV
ncbi:hypothetical protein EN818_31000, partial [Mesorhizobium sp. M3A.F.Ca.ET.175.01.1.1]